MTIPTKEIILIRHGSFLQDGREKEWPLSQEGMNEVFQTAQKLKYMGYKKPISVFSSPFERAMGSAKIICEVLGVDICEERESLSVEYKNTGSPEIFSLLEYPVNPLSPIVVLVSHKPNLESILFYLFRKISMSMGNFDPFASDIKRGGGVVVNIKTGEIKKV